MNNQTIDISSQINIPAQEAFRVLSTNLVLNKDMPSLKVISIISFKTGDGRTTVATNLAVAAAKSGMKTLFVDADIRKPADLKNRSQYYVGLTNYLSVNKIEDFILDTNVKNLKCVLTGTHTVDPVEFLNGSNFESFLDSVTKQFELVIIDCPSNGKYVDGAIIASKASGALIVARANETSYENIERIKWQMKNVGANVIGIVVNRVPLAQYRSYYDIDQ